MTRLLRSRHGIAATEFGLIAPVFFLFIFGMFHLGHMVYAKAVFEGAVERAARESSLETADTDDADDMVEDMVKPILPGVVLTTTRTSYYDFADIARPEKWTDNKGKNSSGQWIDYPGRNNGICDQGEAYIDENRSGQWESDIGTQGNGGAGDVILYTVKATYTPIFKVPFLPAQWTDKQLVATAVKKNQPFGNQTRYAATAGTCT
ncbi:MAG: pilus assembly protein TadE [Sphingomonadales bacterium 32-68-7]|nr:MAG: pilus assembly protein TadE [Sphingomonadales bacterium 12-68-11]OYX08621.1 MAG: pilus assembly protein TadE [Sphingomonadales bacterium 32-68-7]